MRGGEKNAKRQVIGVLIPASYVRAKGEKGGWYLERKQAGRWGKNNTNKKHSQKGGRGDGGEEGQKKNVLSDVITSLPPPPPCTPLGNVRMNPQEADYYAGTQGGASLGFTCPAKVLHNQS